MPRVSSVGQNLDSQLDALQKAGCKKILSDKMTGFRMDVHALMRKYGLEPVVKF